MAMTFSFFAVIAIVVVALIGALSGLHFVFGVILPYAAFAIFLVGFVNKVLNWASSPVPFRIPTTAGQQKTLPWISDSKLDNPTTTIGVIGRMVLEILFFRSLFRNTSTELRSGNLVHGPAKWLWLFALIFHWSFLLIALRHLRLFVEPVPFLIQGIESIDGMLQVGSPPIYISDLLIIAGVTFLFMRRVILPRIKYISLAADFFPLFLIFAIAATGILMRFVFRVDIVGIKTLLVSLANFSPVVPDGIGVIFFIHVALVSALMAYFPFSKLMHMGGVFLSPTRNMANNSRAVRHINPWNYPVKFHHYDEYEDHFRDVMKDAGLPLEKE